MMVETIDIRFMFKLLGLTILAAGGYMMYCGVEKKKPGYFFGAAPTIVVGFWLMN